MRELNVSDIINLFVKKVKIVIIGVVSMLFLGMVHYLTSPNEYISTTKLLPIIEQSNKIPGNLGNIAGLAGIDLNSGNSSTIPPSLYPDVINSTPFSLSLMETQFYYGEIEDSIKLIDYFYNFTQVSSFNKLKKLPFNLFRKSYWSGNDEGLVYYDGDNTSYGSNLIKLDSWQNSARSQIVNRVSAEVDKINGTVIIQVKMQDAELAAGVANFTQQYLTEYIIDYKSGREFKNLEFAEARLQEAKDAYNKAQLRLANFQDQNLNVSRTSVQVRGEEFRNEASIAFNVYNNLAQEVEQTKIRVQRELPVFKVLDPPMVPLRESSPKLILNLVIFGFIGLMFSSIFILVYYNNEE